MLEMKIVLAEALRRFDLKAAGPEPELAKRRNITIYPGDNARVALGARERIAVPA